MRQRQITSTDREAPTSVGTSFVRLPPGDSLMDFSAWFEVYLRARWYTFDARHNKPRVS
jgi:transglutaminase-like putative cysteine protease